MEKVNLHTGHRDRVKKRFLKNGIESFDDHQVLEMLLFYAIPYRDTNEIAHTLIKHFGSLSKVFEAEVSELQKIDGIGSNAAVLLSFLPQVARRYMQNRMGDKVLIDSATKAKEFCKNLYLGLTKEVFYIVCLNTQKEVLYAALVHEGTINETPVYPRSIVETALRHNAHSVILSHNHPSGSQVKPSEADVIITERLVKALRTVDVAVVDHIIVGFDECFSFAQNKIFQKFLKI